MSLFAAANVYEPVDSGLQPDPFSYLHLPPDTPPSGPPQPLPVETTSSSPTWNLRKLQAAIPGTSSSGHHSSSSLSSLDVNPPHRTRQRSSTLTQTSLLQELLSAGSIFRPGEGLGFETGSETMSNMYGQTMPMEMDYQAQVNGNRENNVPIDYRNMGCNMVMAPSQQKADFIVPTGGATVYHQNGNAIPPQHHRPQLALETSFNHNNLQQSMNQQPQSAQVELFNMPSGCEESPMYPSSGPCPPMSQDNGSSQDLANSATLTNPFANGQMYGTQFQQFPTSNGMNGIDGKQGADFVYPTPLPSAGLNGDRFNGMLPMDGNFDSPASSMYGQPRPYPWDQQQMFQNPNDGSFSANPVLMHQGSSDSPIGFRSTASSMSSSSNPFPQQVNIPEPTYSQPNSASVMPGQGFANQPIYQATPVYPPPMPATEVQQEEVPLLDSLHVDVSRLSVEDWGAMVGSYIKSYINAPNRYAFGERTITINTPRVGQKSYGTEKRFLCPPPIATITGRTWWSKEVGGMRIPPTINLGLTDEQPVADASPSWITTHARVFEETIDRSFRQGEEPFIGKAHGKNLHISDIEDKTKQRVVKALVTVREPISAQAMLLHRSGQVSDPVANTLGVFESNEIKIISKPSKKRNNTRMSDLCLHHGTTVSFYNRIRSQTTSTKFLAVMTDLSKIKGSDGKPLPVDARFQPTNAGFVADPQSWDPFHIWLVDPRKPEPTEVRPNPDGETFPPPSDVIDMPSSGTLPVISFNNCVRLQCLTTGLLSPMLVIRRVETGSTVSSGDGIFKDGDPSRCPPGELPAEPVCQLHKVAFELYAAPNLPTSPVWGNDNRNPGLWLTCERERIEFRQARTQRTWVGPSPVVNTGSAGTRSMPSSVPASPVIGYHPSMTPLTPRSASINGGFGHPATPTSPAMQYSPYANQQQGQQPNGADYFTSRKHSNSPSLHSPSSQSGSNTPWGEPPAAESSQGPGPIRRRRTSSGASSFASRNGHTSPPLLRQAGRKASIESVNQVQPLSKSFTEQGFYLPEPGSAPTSSGSGQQESTKWQLDLLDTSTWTIVGTETKSYTFWVPPYVEELSQPITPFPSLSKYLPPGVAVTDAELEKYNNHFTTLSGLPMATFYGSGFAKKPSGESRYLIFYGTEQAGHHEVRCRDVLAASLPTEAENEGKAISLIRDDGECVYPTKVLWKSEYVEDEEEM